MNVGLIEQSYKEINDKEPYLPENYHPIGPTNVSTGEELDRKRLLQRNLYKQSVPVWYIKIEKKDFQTKKPILLALYKDGEYFFSENKTLAIYGTGQTPKDALENAKKHIVHFFEYYKKIDKSKLIGKGLKLKSIYDDLFVEGCL